MDVQLEGVAKSEACLAEASNSRASKGEAKVRPDPSSIFVDKRQARGSKQPLTDGSEVSTNGDRRLCRYSASNLRS